MSSSRLGSMAPVMIDESNLSRAWARAILHVQEHAGTDIVPLIVSISAFDDERVVQEDPALRAALDDLLRKTDNWDVETVAFTIFPNQIWKIAAGDRARLFSLYRDTVPRYRAMNKTNNGRGLYFERMTMYGAGPCDGNQLEFIISQQLSRTGVRRSMLQTAVFDPGRDHVTSAQLGFPCLQHVTFVPMKAGLVVNAFYATQQLFDKAYGNYLGLARLGAFMAHEMRLPLVRLNVFAGVAKLERIAKTDAGLTAIVEALRRPAASVQGPALPAVATKSTPRAEGRV